MQDLINVRKFEDSDMERVKQIENLSTRELTPLSSILQFYNVHPEGFVVADLSGKVIGFLVVEIRSISGGESEGHILSIAVDPEYRKKGVGVRLLGYMDKMLREKGIKRVALEVKLNNVGAQEFYVHLGYLKSHVIKRYYRMRGYSEDALIMYKYL